MDALRRAIEQALLNGELFDEEMRDRLDQMQMEGELDELIESSSSACSRKTNLDRQPHDRQKFERGGQVGDPQQSPFEITDKSLDSSDSKPCATCSDRSQVQFRTPRHPRHGDGIEPAARRSPTNSATRSISTSPRRSRTPST